VIRTIITSFLFRFYDLWALPETFSFLFFEEAPADFPLAEKSVECSLEEAPIPFPLGKALVGFALGGLLSTISEILTGMPIDYEFGQR